MNLTVGLLAYDIAHDRRRVRIHRLLSAYGQPLQESVFLLALRDTQWQELQRRLVMLVNAGEDDVRVWPLCAACRNRTLVWCGAPAPVAGVAAAIV